MFWDVVKIRVNDWRGRYNKVQQAPVSAPVIK
jgi:hypothetical protein